MEEFIASLTQFFTDWGYVGLFLSAFVAGSILPFSSEVVLVILVRMGLDPFLEGKGALFAFFTFLPYVGEAVAIVLGLMRSNVWITAVAMFVGKLLRYVAIVAALQGVLSWF